MHAMAPQKLFSFPLVIMIILQLGVPNFAQAASGALKFGFYHKTCPSLERIVRDTTSKYIFKAPTLAAPLLRIQFHDCIVRGCDASVLLNSTKTNQAERDAPPNLFLRGFQVIDAVKSALEKACPGVVSCADTLALVARDAISLIHGPFWEVELGRRDGRVSSATEALASLPGPQFNITQLKSTFLSNGLTVKDLAVLSGAHTIGIAHCFLFANRLYNFTGKGDTDPSLDSEYIPHLKRKCKPGDFNTFVEMDPGSFKTFDKSYYTLVAKRRGLLESDAALLHDTETKSYVELQANTFGFTFYKDFAESMIHLGRVGVLTGKAGEIRKQCSFVN